MKVEPSIMHDYIIPIVIGAVTSVGTFIWWVGRVIFTNHQRINELESDNKHAQDLRERQEKMISEIRNDQKTLLTHMLKEKGRE